MPILIAAGADALIGAVLSRVMHEHQATRVQEQLARGGSPFWVNVRDAREEETAQEVVRADSAHDVHVGDMVLAGGHGNVPLGVLNGCKPIGGRVLSHPVAAASLRRAVPA